MLEEFTEIYDKERWGKGKGSGSGSSPNYCRKFVAYLNGIIHDEEIKTVLDLGCGDWQYAQMINWPYYLGVDVVESVVQELLRKHKGDYHFDCVDFQNPDNLKEIFGVDHYELVIIKDVFQHWTDNEILPFMETLMAQDWTTLILVNDWHYIRDKSKNDGRPRDLNNPWRWAPIDALEDSVLSPWKFTLELNYYAKQVVRLDK